MMARPTHKTAAVRYITSDLSIAELDHVQWGTADPIQIDTYWNGLTAPEHRSFSVRLLWSETAFYARFEARQGEPLNISSAPRFAEKSLGLWDRDVCEIFVAPDPSVPERYFEFEVAPTGEWVDVALDSTGDSRVSDWDYSSGMISAARVGKSGVVAAMTLPWTAFGRSPAAGDIWRGNLLRCVGEDPDRGYLAWSPTMTLEPNFHVPDKFGRFEFVG